MSTYSLCIDVPKSDILVIKVHPCDRDDNGGCTQRCVKTVVEADKEEEEEEVDHAYKCECGKGFKLGYDGKTCHLGKRRMLPRGKCCHTCSPMVSQTLTALKCNMFKVINRRTWLY